MKYKTLYRIVTGQFEKATNWTTLNNAISKRNQLVSNGRKAVDVRIVDSNNHIVSGDTQ